MRIRNFVQSAIRSTSSQLNPARLPLAGLLPALALGGCVAVPEIGRAHV